MEVPALGASDHPDEYDEEPNDDGNWVLELDAKESEPKTEFWPDLSLVAHQCFNQTIASSILLQSFLMILQKR